MTDFMELGQRTLQAEPFSRLLGSELEHLAAGEAVLTLTVREDFLQQHGHVHGGVLSYLADNVLTFAGGAQFGDAVTVEYKINYVHPARPSV